MIALSPESRLPKRLSAARAAAHPPLHSAICDAIEISTKSLTKQLPSSEPSPIHRRLIQASIRYGDYFLKWVIPLFQNGLWGHCGVLRLADESRGQTSIGTGYDLSNSVFSPDGRNFQVEYATKAVESGGTAIGIRCKDGVVLAVEKLIGSKLLVPGSNKRIATVDRHVGIACSGLVPDARHFTSRARSEAASWRKFYHAPIPVSSLADRMGGYAQAYTLYSSVRPFGVTAIIGGMDEEGGPGLWMVEPSGVGWGYFGAATGRGRQAAKAELEKLPLPNITVKEAVKHAARIIYFAHDDNSKDKDFELEMTWVRLEGEAEDGVAVKGWGKHEEVPKELVAEAEKLAKESMVEGGGDDEEMEVEE